MTPDAYGGSVLASTGGADTLEAHRDKGRMGVVIPKMVHVKAGDQGLPPERQIPPPTHLIEQLLLIF